MKRRLIYGMIAATLMVAAFGTMIGRGRPFAMPRSTRWLPSDRPEGDSVSRLYDVQSSINTTRFLDLPRYSSAWQNVTSPPTAPGQVVAGVVNHHVLASDLLARFFRGLREARPDVRRIILLSPDHFGASRAPVSTHERAYMTETGAVMIDTTTTRQLVSRRFAVNESGALFETEHGVGALIPFLRHEFPEVKLVPVAIRGSIHRETARSLGRELASFVDDQTVVIVSSDMSHYLSEEVALRNDEKTRMWLQILDAKQLGLATDDYTDNGVAFVVLSELLKTKNISPVFTLYDHSISTQYGGPANYTTSYITGVWSVR